MSNRTDLTLMLDNRANVSKETVGLVKISGNNINVFEINADGSTWPTQITFNNIVVPNYQNTVVSRNARVRYQLSVALQTNAADASRPVMPANNVIPGVGNTTTINTVLRDFPLQSNCSNVQVVINGATTTINSQQVLTALKRTLPMDWLKNQATECPCMLDNVAGYAITMDAAAHCNQIFSSKYNSDGITRGSFMAYTSSTAANITTWIFNISESLLISPFTIYDDEVWLSNINTMSLQFNYQNLLDTVVASLATVVSPTALNVTLSNPRLQLSYMQLSPDLVSIPRLTTLPYENIVYFPKTSTGPANWNNTIGTIQLQSDTLRFSSLPERIFAFARCPIANRINAGTAGNQFNYPDAMYGLGDPSSGLANIQVSIGTRTGLLASSSIATMYRMAKKNGYNSNYNDYTMGSGGLIVIDPVEDLGVDLNAGDVLPGESGSVNFQINLTINNYNVLAAGVGSPWAVANPPIELMVVAVYSGTANITPDGCVFNTGELAPAEIDALIRTAPKDGSMTSTETFRPNIKAGSLFSKFKSVLGTVADGLKSDAGQKALGYIAKKARGGAFTAA
jgi:hypothetical protein